MREYRATRRILVAGGAGFIGSHLCERLLAAGHEVVCADNLSTGSKGNIAALLNHRRFEFVRHDVALPLDVAVDEIYNLTGSPAPDARVPGAFTGAAAAARNAALNLLELARRVEARILCASPAAETLCFQHHQHHGVQVKAARLFDVYGPRMRRDEGDVIAELIVAAMSDQPLMLSGDGAQPRSPLYVDDAVDGLIALMATSREFTGPVNLAHPGSWTLDELSRKIIALADSRSRRRLSAEPANDPLYRKPDIRLAQERLGWMPHTSLDAGLRETIRYFELSLLPRQRVVSTAPITSKPESVSVAGD